MKLFVWDFHGVLEKGNDLAVLEITNHVLKTNGYKRVMTKSESYELSGRKWFEYFQHLLPDADLEVCLKLQKECVNMGLKNPELIEKHTKINDFVPEVLSSVKKLHDQILISNSQPKSFRNFLKITNVGDYFGKDKAIAVNAHQINKQKSKKDVLNKYLDGKSFKKIVVIGDSPEDMELGSGLDSVRYLYSHPGTNHREADADHYIHDLREVLREL